MEEWPAVSQNPWWHPSDDDRGWDEPLPRQILLAPDYMAELPPWGEGFGNIDWRFTKFPPELLDRLAAWQREFDDNSHPWESGWRSAAIRDRWAHQAEDLAADVRAALSIRAELVVDLWPVKDEARPIPSRLK